MELSNKTCALIIIIMIILSPSVGIAYAIFTEREDRGGFVNSITLFAITSEFQDIDQKQR